MSAITLVLGIWHWDLVTHEVPQPKAASQPKDLVSLACVNLGAGVALGCPVT